MAKSNKRQKLEKKRQKKTKKRREQVSGQQAREAASARRGAVQKVAQARATWAEGRHNDSLKLYERAIACDPKNAALIVEAARSYGQRFDYQRANALIERADAVAPNDVSVQSSIGDLYITLQDFPSAERCYLHILQQKPDRKHRVRAQVALARIYERLHRIDEATEMVDLAIKDWPEHPNANFYAAKLLRRKGQNDAAIESFKQLTHRSDISPEIKANAWYEIAKQQDQSQDFDNAFASLLEAKRSYDNQTEQAWRVANKISDNNRMMLNAISVDHFKRWAVRSHELTPLPGQLSWLIGHPRSGTTLIEQVLDGHDSLVSADELDVLARCVYPELGSKAGEQCDAPSMLDRAESEDIDKARSDYWLKTESALGEPANGRMLLDKNPELTLLLPMICRTFPESKILFAIRDPRDVVISCFSQSLPLNSVSVYYLTLEDTAKKYATVMSGWLKLREMINVDWIEIRYEDTVADLEAQAKRCLDFLKLDWTSDVLDYHKRAQSKHVHSPTYESVTKPIYKSAVGRWRNYEKQLAPVMKILEPFVKEFSYD